MFKEVQSDRDRKWGIEQKATLIAYKGDCYRLEGLFQVSYTCVLSLPSTAAAHCGLLGRVISQAERGNTEPKQDTIQTIDKRQSLVALYLLIFKRLLVYIFENLQ